MKLWKKQKKPFFGVSSCWGLRIPYFLLAQGTKPKMLQTPTGQKGWLLWNFYQRARRGSSQVTLTSGPQFLHFFIKQISAQRPWIFLHQNFFFFYLEKVGALSKGPVPRLAFRESIDSWTWETSWIKDQLLDSIGKEKIVPIELIPWDLRLRFQS